MAVTTQTSQGLSWRKGDEIGRGTYGCVFMAQDKANGHIFAVKVSRFDDGDEKDAEYCEKLRKELRFVEICGIDTS